MTLEKRIKAFDALGDKIKNLSEDDSASLFRQAANENAWFTPTSISYALEGIQIFLHAQALNEWAENYRIKDQGKWVGIVMAGNIPMVGFHDLLSVLVSGNNAMVKLSSSDSVLVKTLIGWLIEIEPDFEKTISIVDRLNDAEAIIATGSNNTARYFHYYFSKKPHIIRQNRTSVAVLTGDESADEISELAKDIFTYYGLGCRNVSKLFIPKGFDLTGFLDALSKTSYQNITEHHKYNNNYDYNNSIYLVNGNDHLDTGFVLLKKEPEQLVSPISVIFYDHYDSPQQLQLTLAGLQDKIQCTVGNADWLDGLVPFGHTQQPQLNDYADGVDTMEFLTNLK